MTQGMKPHPMRNPLRNSQARAPQQQSIAQAATPQTESSAMRGRFAGPIVQAPSTDLPPPVPSGAAVVPPSRPVASGASYLMNPPPAQIQPHQVQRTSDFAGDVPQPGAPSYAPQSGRVIPAGTHPQTAERVVTPQQTLPQSQRGDVTVILYSSGYNSALISQQIAALRRQTMQPAVVWVHVDGLRNHDEKTISKCVAFRTAVSMGRYFRLEIARNAGTRWVAILDEDAMPGPTWLETAVRSLEMIPSEFATPVGPGVIACAGTTFVDHERVHVVGPEMPREEAERVHFGRLGWVFAPEFAREATRYPRVGVGPSAFAMTIGAAAANVGIPIAVPEYGIDPSRWAVTKRSDLPDTAEDATAQLQVLVGECGWQIWPDEQIAMEAPPEAPAPTAVPPQAAAPTAPAVLPGIDPTNGWKEERYDNTVVREKVLTPEESDLARRGGAPKEEPPKWDLTP